MPDHENILTPPLMLVRYAGMASLLATVWESRRKLQERAAELAQWKRRHIQQVFRAVGDLDRFHRMFDPEQPDLAIVFDNLLDERDALRHRNAELEAFVADLACHGLRLDADPTRPIRSPEQRKADLENYLRHADQALREDARRFVPDADRPYIAGRPRPAPRVEVVAESVTELDLLRAQDGDR